MNVQDRPVPRPGVLDIDAYVPGRSEAPGAKKIFKLSANETPLGASPKAIEAYRGMADRLHDYPDGSHAQLREAIAKSFGLDATRIVCGSGSDELLNLLAQAYLSAGDEAVYSRHGFVVYPNATRAAGGRPVAAPENNLTTDVDAMLAAVTPRTKVVFLANPNNPTGTYVPFSEVRRLHAGLAPHVLLVLDAAYAEYVRRNDYEAGIELAGASENVVMTRTFSKIHGLAALRLGWMYAPASVVDAVNRTRGPFNVNAPALAAGLASLSDTEHLEKSVAHNSRWLPWLTDELTGLGLEVTPSVGNFLLVHFPRERGMTAGEADAFLLARGLVLRGVGVYHLPDALRLTVGTEEANGLVISALSEFMARETLRA